MNQPVAPRPAATVVLLLTAAWYAPCCRDWRTALMAWS